MEREQKSEAPVVEPMVPKDPVGGDNVKSTDVDTGSKEEYNEYVSYLWLLIISSQHVMNWYSSIVE